MQASEYNKVNSALRVLDFTPDAIDSIWAMTAAILHLGNVEFFLDENDTAGIRNMDIVDKVCRIIHPRKRAKLSLYFELLMII